jgi:hypothetical protein
MKPYSVWQSLHLAEYTSFPRATQQSVDAEFEGCLFAATAATTVVCPQRNTDIEPPKNK